MGSTITEEEVGKRVETATGEDVGVVAAVDGRTAHVERDPGALDSLKAALGREFEGDDDPIRLTSDDVETITQGTVRLARGEAVDDASETADDEVETDEAGRSGKALEPGTEGMDEAGDERHPDTEEAPPEGDRTVTTDRGREEDR
jgi:hypothetical protein